jgi:chitin deacetylase
VAKPNRIFLRNLIFITLVAATCSFIIGVIWPVNQSNRQTIQVTEPLRQASPLTPLPQETALKQQMQQIAETFPIPTEFHAKIVKKIKSLGEEKVIALTFDDGPWLRSTLQVLEILKKEDIRATFFWVGQYVQAYPELARQVVANGHAIGNHTWHHWYHQLDRATSAHEIEDTAALIYKTTGIKTLVFRPPGGLLNNGVGDYAKEQSYVTVMWSIDSMDYRPFNAQQLVKNVIRKAEPGGIVLMHDGGGNRSATIEALPQIISQLKQLGYSFVTVPQLLEMNEKGQSRTLGNESHPTSPFTAFTKP